VGDSDARVFHGPIPRLTALEVVRRNSVIKLTGEKSVGTGAESVDAATKSLCTGAKSVRIGAESVCTEFKSLATVPVSV
jgi:hypothetical protein